MSRQDRNAEDNDNYAAIIYSTQQMGEALYQKLQTQQYSQVLIIFFLFIYFKMNAPQMSGLNNIDTNQPGAFGGQSSNKQSYGTQAFGQPQAQGQMHKEYQIEDDEPGYQNEESMGGSYGNPMGGYQMQGGYNGYNYGGNQGSFGAGQGGYGGQQQYDPQGHY